jgi:hypothetical protein
MLLDRAIVVEFVVAYNDGRGGWMTSWFTS